MPLLATPAFAKSAVAVEAAHRVNIAGRQRMLSQRMTKAACFIQKGVNTEAHLKMLEDAWSLFSASHDALRFGHEDAGLTVEKMPSVIDALSEVDHSWGIYASYVQVILSSGQINQNQIAQMDEAGLVLLRDTNNAVNTIAADYGNLLDDLPLILSNTIDVAGRQRMLTQKAAKEFCLVESGIDAAANRKNLAGTIQLFSDVLDALITGVPGMVVAPPTKTATAKLNQVKSEWEIPQLIFARTIAEIPACCGHSRVIAEQTELVLDYMNQVVSMYEIAQ